VTLRTNDPENPDLPLIVEANVAPDILFEPDTLHLVTDDPIRRKQIARLTGRVFGRARLSLSEVRGDPSALKHVEVKVTQAPYDANNGPQLEVSLKGKNPGAGSGVAMVLTGIPDSFQLYVKFDWGPAAKIKPAPGR
jgi:hypothetical protein